MWAESGRSEGAPGRTSAQTRPQGPGKDVALAPDPFSLSLLHFIAASRAKTMWPSSHSSFWGIEKLNLLTAPRTQCS